MRNRRRAHPGSWQAVAVLVLLSLLLGACASDMSEIFDMDGPDRVAPSTGSPSLPLGSWTRDSLFCSVGRCGKTYQIEVQNPGMLQVDVYAPVGEGLPDCDLSLETESGEQLETRMRRMKAQRRLSYHAAEAGTYFLRVTSTGASKDLFDFEVVAQLDKGAQPERFIPIAKTEPVPKKKPATIPRAVAPPKKDLKPATLLPREPDPAPVTEEVVEEAPPPEKVWLTAEVLDVEETSGRPSAVMLEAGSPQGIGPGMRGELFEGDTVIGRIEIVDVYPTGSRAKILGSLSAPVSFDTYSRIELPPQAATTSGE